METYQDTSLVDLWVEYDDLTRQIDEINLQISELQRYLVELNEEQAELIRLISKQGEIDWG